MYADSDAAALIPPTKTFTKTAFIMLFTVKLLVLNTKDQPTVIADWSSYKEKPLACLTENLKE